jgi:hypothetical protein
MYKIIRFKEERLFSDVQKSFMNKIGKYNVSDPFHRNSSNHEEVKKGLQKSFYSYTHLKENVKVLPYFYTGDCSISLCISCGARYVEGSIIPPKLKIIGLFIKTPWCDEESHPDFHKFANSI